MNRDIKFRAWHKEHKEMIYFDNEKASKDQYQSSAILRLMCDNSGLLMQFTGLKDNTGRDIYEGDVLKFDPNQRGSDDGVFTVKWNEKDGEWDTGVGTNSECAIFKTVVGHVFEGFCCND